MVHFQKVMQSIWMHFTIVSKIMKKKVNSMTEWQEAKKTLIQGSFNILQSVMLEIRQDVGKEDEHEQHRKPVALRRPPEYHHTRAKDTQSSQTSSSMCAQVRTNQPSQVVRAFLSAFRGWGRWIWVQGKPGLQREFQNYQKYIESVSGKPKTNKNQDQV